VHLVGYLKRKNPPNQTLSGLQ